MMKLQLNNFKMEQKQVQWSAAHEEDNSRRKACLEHHHNTNKNHFKTLNYDRKNSKKNS